MKSDNMWVACATCGKQVSVKAKSCPNCGHVMKKSGRWKWIAGGLLGLFVIGVALSPQKPAADKQGVSSATKNVAATSPAKPSLPATQNSFIKLIGDYKTRFGKASNELQESAMRDERAKAIVSVLGPQLEADGWLGTLRQLETNTEGKAIVTVRLAPDLDILTWNNALTDSIYSTMIEKSSPVYASLMDMSVGDKVKVSGRFIPTDGDLLEGSITIKGAMTAPEFLFRFSDITSN